ncbi:MAG: hypothetical protein KKA22_09195 [Gammaproteobacteria bacterium]|nr:hypothetical protein [Gammaproteobacteria bacterium]MBU1408304.1 hypothetical protein [Gammaproteobacteria bacterium]MBU1532117.1 hypothetical protein [Gammaproteobacteria bacterium]
MKVFWDENGDRIYFGPGKPIEQPKAQPSKAENRPVPEPPAEPDPRFLIVARYQFIYSIVGLVLGLVCIIGGMVLFFAGVTGSINWTAKVGNAESTLANGSPGIVLFLVGLFVVWVSRFSVTLKK